MGSSSSMICGGGSKDVAGTAELTQPFEEFNKKERGLLRDTWTQIDEPKEVVGRILVEIIESHPELKPAFGVKMVPPATMLKMPIAGGHVKQFVDLMDSVTNLLGFLENPLGASQLLRKVGRAHARVPFLQSNPSNNAAQPLHYFEMFSEVSLRQLMPHLSEDLAQKSPGTDENRRVRFAQSYPMQQVQNVWSRFMSVCVQQIYVAYESELRRQQNEQSLKALAPQQRIEEAERREKMLKDKRENEPVIIQEDKKEEELYEDPF